MAFKSMSLPPRTEWAIDRLAKALRSEGYDSAQVGVNGGEPSHVSLFDADGTQHYFMRDEGRWYLYYELEEAADGR